jgi:hypothetical protein
MALDEDIHTPAHLPRSVLRGHTERQLVDYFQERARYNGTFGEPGQEYCIFAEGEYLYAATLSDLFLSYRNWARSPDDSASQQRLAS